MIKTVGEARREQRLTVREMGWYLDMPAQRYAWLEENPDEMTIEEGEIISKVLRVDMRLLFPHIFGYIVS
jgi:hypothetical protein